MESGAVTVIHGELGRQPDWKNGCHESFSFVRESKLLKDEENRVNVYNGDTCVVDEGGDGFRLRKARCMGRR